MKLSFSFTAAVLALFSAADASIVGIRGVASSAGGACELESGTNIDTCRNNKFCQLPTGECNKMTVSHSGTCARPPEMCTADYRPVCGCDGNTYSNECAAHSNGVSVSMEGSCESSPGDSCERDSSTGTDTCTGPFFCELKTGVCNTKIMIHSGQCERIPEMCTMDMNEVCGCDGKTYPNECTAHASGVSVSQTGPCNPAPPPSASRRSCSVGTKSRSHCNRDGEFCKVPAGDCVTNKKNAAGTCEQTPEICPYNIDEVCGCDYVTYDNECVMNAAGVSKRRDGPCSRNGGEDDEDEAEEEDAEFIVVNA